MLLVYVVMTNHEPAFKNTDYNSNDSLIILYSNIQAIRPFKFPLNFRYEILNTANSSFLYFVFTFFTNTDTNDEVYKYSIISQIY